MRPAQGKCEERNALRPDLAAGVSPPRARGRRTGRNNLRYKERGSVAMTESSLMQAAGLSSDTSRKLVQECGQGIVGDIGERADAYPACEIESISTFPMALPPPSLLEQAMAARTSADEVFPNAAGIDIGASSHWVAVPRRSAAAPVREFGVMTDDLQALADWLIACGVDTVAVESTGAYWIAVYELLEQRGLTVWLVDARQMKYVPGRKSDIQDCQWLQKLMSLGFLRAAWRPSGDVCVVRAVARQRDVLLTEQASWVQRIQKALVQMNIQLTEVLTDVMGMTGQAIIRAIVAGERDPTVLARHRHGSVKASVEEVRRALTGNWRQEHLFVLRQALSMYDDIARYLSECDAKLQELMVPLRRCEVDMGKAPRQGSKLRHDYDLRQTLANWAGVDLTRINGLGSVVALKILSELGPDLSKFATVKHFCSWLGLCPGTKISGGRVLSAKMKRSVNRVRQGLKMAAMSLTHSDSALGAFYRRLCTRMAKPQAISATAHKLARRVYFMLTRGEAFVDEGQNAYEEQQHARSLAALQRRAAAFGFELNPILATA